MKHWLIGRWVRFKYCMQFDRRQWTVDDELHRDDGGPTTEDIGSGICWWYEYGIFVRIS